MNYFAQFLKTETPGSLKPPPDIVAEFHHAWSIVQYTLTHPDERQLARGIQSTGVPTCLKTLTDHLVSEATRTEEGTTGGCLEYLLKNDVLGELVKLSQNDRPYGVRAQVLRCIANMVCMLDEHFLVHTAVHRPILKLLKICVGDELEENLDGHGRVMGAASVSKRAKPSQYEEDLVDLLCTLCSRIRTYRDLLMIFFYDKRWFRAPSPDGDPDYDAEDEDEERYPEESSLNLPPEPTESISSISKKPEYEFIIFNYLLRFVHREGRIGDFARAGMLFLIDVAMDTPKQSPQGNNSTAQPNFDEDRETDPASEAASALAEYILEGDFAEVLSAGLAAVYSLLPSKLKLISPSSQTNTSGLVLSLDDDHNNVGSDNNHYGVPAGLSTSRDFCGKLDHFLTILEFIQDVLKRDRTDSNVHNHGDATLVHAVLAAIRKVFLDNVLYPSVLESSELDGSSVAVMSYLEAAFRTLPSGPLVKSILDYLLNEEIESSKVPTSLSSGRTVLTKSDKMRRRKSSAMILLEMEAPIAQDGPYYARTFGGFTLKDLIKSNLTCGNAQAATAAFQLLQTLLYSHCEATVGRLVEIDLAPSDGSPLWWQDQVATPASVACDQFGDEEVPPSHSFLAHERAIQMYRQLAEQDEEPLDIAFSTGYSHYLEDSIRELLNQRCYRDQSGVHLHSHYLRTGDPVLKTVILSLSQFFLHSPQENIALTGFLIKIALCPHRSLKGWLIAETLPCSGDPHVSQDGRREEASHWGSLQDAEEQLSSRPIIYIILSELFSALSRERLIIEDFDRLLKERRQGLLFSENMQDAIRIPFNLDNKGADIEKITASESLGTPTKRSKTSFFSFLTPTRRTPVKGKREASDSGGSVRTGFRGRGPETSTGAGDAFKEHYEGTRGRWVDPPVAENQLEGPWTSGNHGLHRWAGVEEDVFGVSGGWEEGTGMERSEHVVGDGERVRVQVRLSELLDNVVILEECVKELAAVIEARGCLGIDLLL